MHQGNDDGLRSIGVSPFDEIVYRRLVQDPSSTLTGLASRTGATTARLARSLRRLEKLGLAIRRDGPSMCFVAADPAVAIEALVHQRQSELLRTARVTAELSTAYRESHQEIPGQLVEVLTGHDAVAERFEELQRGCRTEILLCDRPPYVNPPGNPLQDAVLARGVKWRTIYAPESLDSEPALGRAAHLRVCGEQARLLPGLPMKLMVVDRRIALMPLAMQTGIEHSAVIQRSTLLDSMVTLFEVFWSRALPLDQSIAASQAELPETERRLLDLLVIGTKDEAVARALGISLRTLHRRMHRLLQTLDADTRFQAGLQAARRGWV
ncbi:sugar-specific transcriptional regulator TrmB [Kribbella sp. VKM Ac-2571]|uniref:helix-turn-helix domain-containing protein n=1 Tax=Kribbella sp. VKM Ac-2571 TaxID=2512222 RepID=UPI001061248A|nr:helix-turn-helix domain-containing protein [Kribbella sp. VKM Ac-2571]TDO58256.1 sugar-specific transcriptional regulator TrmB [Kribbella sp. VKM Ac-2571]